MQKLTLTRFQQAHRFQITGHGNPVFHAESDILVDGLNSPVKKDGCNREGYNPVPPPCESKPVLHIVFPPEFCAGRLCRQSDHVLEKTSARADSPLSINSSRIAADISSPVI